MMYVTPEDQSIDTKDEALKSAWEERRQLRLDENQLREKIKALDVFIETYVARVKPEYAPAMNQTHISVW